MPRKDPMTGCMVMTNAEFFAAEAEREGKGRSGGELLAETFDQIAAEMHAGEQYDRLFYSDPAEAWGAIRDTLREALEMEDSPLQATELVGVLTVDSKQNLGGSLLYIRAHVRFNDGVVRRVSWCVQHWGGSYWEPDDWDENVEWDEEPVEVLDL